MLSRSDNKSALAELILQHRRPERPDGKDQSTIASVTGAGPWVASASNPYRNGARHLHIEHCDAPHMSPGHGGKDFY